MEDIPEFYPSSSEVDAWITSVWQLADAISVKAEMTEYSGNSEHLGVYQLQGFNRFIRFRPEGTLDSFYAFWQPAMSVPAPLLVHLPGYGAEISIHSELVAQGFNVLHIEPLGYAGPEGRDKSKKLGCDNWPVMRDTVLTGAQGGYRLWLAECIMAVKWAMQQPETLKDRVSFFGTSQGGGGALLMASLFKSKGVRCVAADEPFLTNFPLACWRGAYNLAKPAFDSMPEKAVAWKALGYIDTLSHIHRLKLPVLLTAGGADDVCPPETVQSLYTGLPATRSIMYLDNTRHGYNREFIHLAGAWFRMYA